MNAQFDQMNRMRTCPSCRSRVSALEARCPSCGTNLEGIAATLATPEVTISWGGAFKIATAIMVLPVLVGIMLFFILVGAGLATGL